MSKITMAKIRFYRLILLGTALEQQQSIRKPSEGGEEKEEKENQFGCVHTCTPKFALGERLEVACKVRDNLKHFAGTVTAVKLQNKGIFYEILYDDGDTETYQESELAEKS